MARATQEVGTRLVVSPHVSCSDKRSRLYEARQMSSVSCLRFKTGRLCSRRAKFASIQYGLLLAELNLISTSCILLRFGNLHMLVSCLPSLCHHTTWFRKLDLLFLVGKMGIIIIF